MPQAAPLLPPAESIPIGRRPLHEETAERLRAMIVSGELGSGERVSEKALCLRFGVSRTPLRESLKVLAAEGLIDLLPHRGARVAALTAEAVDEMFPVMGALEALSGELACQRITDEELAEIRALHYQMALHHTRRELDPYFRLNQAIHEKIMDAARNPTLAALYRNLAGRVRRARYLANISRDRWDRAMAEHEQIMQALGARDGKTLARVLAQHLTNKCDALKESIARQDAERV